MAKSCVYDEYEVPVDHAEIMLGMLGIDHSTEGVALPQVLREKYIEMRIPADRFSMRLEVPQLWAIVCASGLVQVAAKPQPTILDLWKAKKVNVGDPVLCTLGKQTNLKGAIINVARDGQVLVQMDDGDERKFSEDKVVLAST